MKGRAHPSPFAALSFPNSKKQPFTAGLTERVFQSPHAKPSLELTLYGDFLHHNRATLTIQPQRISSFVLPTAKQQMNVLTILKQVEGLEYSYIESYVFGVYLFRRTKWCILIFLLLTYIRSLIQENWLRSFDCKNACGQFSLTICHTVLILFCSIPKSCMIVVDLFSAGKVHPCPPFNIVIPLVSSFFPLPVPCSFVCSKPEDLEMWPALFIFCFLAMVISF